MLNGPPVTPGSPRLVKTTGKGQEEMLKMIHIKKEKYNEVASPPRIFCTGDVHTKDIHIRLTEFPPKTPTSSKHDMQPMNNKNCK